MDKSTTQGYGLTEDDNASGQQHTWFRKLETRAGRWSSPDPYNGSMSVGNPQSSNRYAYVGSEPTNFIDPSGLRRWCIDYYVGDGVYHTQCYDFPDFNYPPQEHSVPAGTDGNEQEQNNDTSQQAEFDECARTAFREFRRAEYSAIAKIAGGGAGTTVAARTGMVGVGYLAEWSSLLSRAGARIVRYTFRGRIPQLAAYGGTFGTIFTGEMVLNGFREANANARKKDAAIEDCKSKFPNANQSALHIAAIASRTW